MVFRAELHSEIEIDATAIVINRRTPITVRTCIRPMRPPRSVVRHGSPVAGSPSLDYVVNTVSLFFGRSHLLDVEQRSPGSVHDALVKGRCTAVTGPKSTLPVSSASLSARRWTRNSSSVPLNRLVPSGLTPRRMPSTANVSP